MDYSGHFKLLNNIFYYLLCRKTIANVIITVLKNYICVHMKNILFMINFIQYILKFGHFRSLHDPSVDSAV